MLVKMKDVYYCEYCGKHRLSKTAMVKHELHCTMNPDRVCRMCEFTKLRALVDKYSNRFIMVPGEYGGEQAEWIGNPVTLAQIEDDTECPTCTLAIIRQCGLNQTDVGPSFDYKKEHDDWWAEVNGRREEEQLAAWYAQ